MVDEVSSEDNKNTKSMEIEEKPQTKLSRFISESKDNMKTFSSKTYSKFEPYLLPLKNKYVRYTISALLLGAVIALYVLYESENVIQNPSLKIALVPIGLVIALILVLYATWDNPKLKRFRSPGLYVVVLTAIFYVFIYTDISELLFNTSLARWLTRATGFLTSSIVSGFGINILDTSWVSVTTATETKWMTRIIFQDAPSGQGSLYVDAACSGIHSLTVFIAVFLLMLFESRKRHKWSPLIIIVTLIGVLGTYIMNLIRIMIIISLYYYQDSTLAGNVHNYLGYVILIIWLPVFWLYILPLADSKDVKQERRLRKQQKREARKKKEQDVDQS